LTAPSYALDDFRAVVREVASKGVRPCKFVKAAWLRATEAVKRVIAYLCNTYIADNNLNAADAKKRAEREALPTLVTLAAANIGYHAEAALAMIGAKPRTLWNAPRRKRARAGAAALERKSGDYFWRHTRPHLIEEIADALCELVTRPEILETALQAA
jgi:hypothetical protein